MTTELESQLAKVSAELLATQKQARRETLEDCLHRVEAVRDTVLTASKPPMPDAKAIAANLADAVEAVSRAIELLK